ncbi:MAG: hypothetical protein ACRDRZ_01310 [Pseudonocardiaceae bacterium]
MSAPAVAQTMPVTSATDGRCHHIADDDYTAGLVERSGYYPALCGRRVPAAPMICPPGPDCRSCAATAGAPPPGGPGRHRHTTHRGRHHRALEVP